MSYQTERQTVRLRNATVSAVTSPTVTITMNAGESVLPGIPVYGPTPVVGAKVLVLEQGFSLLVLGNAVTLLAEIESLKSRIDALERNDHGDA